MNLNSFKYIDFDDYSLPKFGFKIHISGTSKNYRDIFSLVMPYLKKCKLSFKYLKNSIEILNNLSDLESPGESGKLITIYPKDRTHCIKILDDLYRIVPQSMEGVYILSGRNCKNSNILFYRYGLIKSSGQNLTSKIPILIGPNDEEWQDFQKNYFDLPEWIEDIQDKQVFHPSYLSDNYQVNSLLKESNGGNVYQAIHIKTNKKVVIKECRPHVICLENVYRKQLRDTEWTIAKSLPLNTNSASCVEVVNEWINTYYIYEYIEGNKLTDFCNKINLFSYKRRELSQNIEKFNRLKNCFLGILETVLYFHEQNIILNDIHPDNFIVNHNSKITFIDMENSYFLYQSPLVGIYSEIALKQWHLKKGIVADCHKIGNLFLYLFGKLHIKNDTVLTSELKSLLFQKGIDSNIHIPIDYLLSAEPNIKEAIQILKSSIHTRRSAYTYKLSNCITVSSDWKHELIKFISFQTELISKYNLLLSNQDAMLEEMKAESNLGMQGLTGILLYLSSMSYDKEIIFKGIEMLLNQLVEDCEGNVGISLEEDSTSPYLLDGTAGVIQLLIFVDPIKYLAHIQKLSQSLLFEYAQFSHLWRGMLGIAIILLQVYNITNDKNYFDKSQELLISSTILSKKDTKLQHEILYFINAISQKIMIP
ncbi:protein kinase domain-containing protein [Streptococcus pluranimalium]|uniref:class III lanthionine synthetase LanKC N-terminal domain-containing protein n=1 Tax=Streptococcus pluranimalium TaxID=82348 RepID=UPI0039FDD759